MRASVNEKKWITTGIPRGSFCKCSFSRKEPSPKYFMCFSMMSSKLNYCDAMRFLECFQLIFLKYTYLWRFSLNFVYPIRNIWEGEAINGTCFNFLISKNNFPFLLITWSEKCIAQTKTCFNSWASLRFRNLSKVFLCCSSSGNGKMLLSRVRHGLWSIRKHCSCWPFSFHIPFSIIEFPFHLEKNWISNAIIFLLAF